MDFGLLLTYVVPFLVILTIVVFFHELGHYAFAKKCGVRVEAFSIGMGPELFGFTDRSGTRWKFSAIPLGGYVKMFADENIASQQAAGDKLAQLSEDEKKQSLAYKTVWERIQVVAAGPIANYILAIAILAPIYMFSGQNIPAEDRIGAVLQGGAAHEAGFQAEDRIISVDGRHFTQFKDLTAYIRAQGESASLDFVIDRAGTILNLAVTPKVTEIKNEDGSTRKLSLIGVAQGHEKVKRGIIDSWYYATKFCMDVTWKTLQMLGRMIVGQESTNGLSGPIGIAKFIGDNASGDIVMLLTLMAFLSINLGLVNFLPIPVLDGGHLLFYFIEAIRGKPLSEKVQEYAFNAGLAVVIGLMLFSTWNDLSRLSVFQWISNFFAG